jgi:hypothetical protein
LGCGEIAFQLVEHGQSGIVGVNAEEDFVFWVVLTAEAGEVLICLRVEAENRLDIANGRQKAGWLELGYSEIAKAAEDGDAVVEEWDCG